jgi:hypothetical protein
LVVIQFANIIQLVDDQLFDVSFIDFWVALNAKYAVFNVPDFVLTTYGVCACSQRLPSLGQL